jgi:Cof subfamily protein (haloacid dehalogenase superfamily)
MELTGRLARRLARVRLCVLDVDGTLLDSRHRVGAATKAAVRRAIDSGLSVMLATSRGPCALRPVVDQVAPLAGQAFVASQGAVLGRYVAGRLEVLEHRPAPLGDALAVAERAAGLGLSVSWYAREQWLVPALDELVARESRITGAAPTVAVLRDQTEGPDKLMLVARDGEQGRLLELADRLPGSLHAQISNPTYLEVTVRDVDKASTVRRFCAREGFARDEVLAVGDGPNDLPVFAVAGVSAAPANARENVLAAADLVVASNDDDGVAVLLDSVVRAVRGGPG